MTSQMKSLLCVFDAFFAIIERIKVKFNVLLEFEIHLTFYVGVN